MRPSKWVTPSGKVHRRRLRFHLRDTPTPARPELGVITLCGTRSPLTPAPKGAVVTCLVCIKASNTKAHLRGVVRL